MTLAEDTQRSGRHGREGCSRRIALDLTSSLALGLGLILMVSPLFFYWFIHGDHDRYLWISNGPPPFRQFGGGPYQLFMLGVLPFVGGVALVAVGMVMRLRR